MLFLSPDSPWTRARALTRTHPQTASRPQRTSLDMSYMWRLTPYATCTISPPNQTLTIEKRTPKASKSMSRLFSYKSIKATKLHSWFLTCLLEMHSDIQSTPSSFHDSHTRSSPRVVLLCILPTANTELIWTSFECAGSASGRYSIAGCSTPLRKRKRYDGAWHYEVHRSDPSSAIAASVSTSMIRGCVPAGRAAGCSRDCHDGT